VTASPSSAVLYIGLQLLYRRSVGVRVSRHRAARILTEVCPDASSVVGQELTKSVDVILKGVDYSPFVGVQISYEELGGLKRCPSHPSVLVGLRDTEAAAGLAGVA
jgi:hypothetical protein